MAELVLSSVTKTFGETEVVKGLDLTIPDREFVVLVGPSGCGKSTTLRMIAGLDSVTSGDIRIGGRRVNDLTPGQRDIAMVFQSYALYPHMSVRRNIAFALRRRNLGRVEVAKRVDEVARLLEIEPLLPRRPRALSGGQRQRVAIGRALVREPRVFLFDEPLSNLDARLRAQMRLEIKRLHQAMPTTTVFVTHDQVEAMTMADRVVVMNEGRIEQVGTPMEIYRHPATRFVASFIGSPMMNFFPCALEEGEGGLTLALKDGPRLPVPAARADAWAKHRGRDLTLGLRPEALSPSPGGASLGPAHVSVTEPLGTETLIYLTLAGTEAAARLSPDQAPRPGETVTLSADFTQAHLIDNATGKVLS
ncbi:ABC transporter ATP-binding protein [Pseudoroseicyclus sp. H15]